MKKIILMITIAISLTACCTKKECVYTPAFTVKFKGVNKEVEVSTIYNGVKSSTNMYSQLEDTTLSFPITNQSQSTYSIEIKVGDSTLVFEDFKTELKEIIETECNKCFLKKERQEIYNISEFKANSTIFNQNHYEIYY